MPRSIDLAAWSRKPSASLSFATRAAPVKPFPTFERDLGLYPRAELGLDVVTIVDAAVPTVADEGDLDDLGRDGADADDEPLFFLLFPPADPNKASRLFSLSRKCFGPTGLLLDDELDPFFFFGAPNKASRLAASFDR